MGSNQKNKIIFKLHVSNLPSDVTESKLLALFRKHGNAISVYINDASASGRWALIDYNDYNEATEAIMKLDRAPPYNLCVKLSKKTIDQLENIAQDDARFSGDASVEEDKKPILLCRGRGRLVPFLGPPPSLLIPKRILSSNYYRGENFGCETQSYNINFLDDDLSDQIDSISMKVDYIPQTSQAVMRGRGLYQPSDFIDEIQSKISTRYSDKISNAELTIGPSIHDLQKPQNSETLRIKKFEHFYTRNGKNIIHSLSNQFNFKINKIIGEDTIIASVIVDYEINQNLISDTNFKPFLGEMVYAMMDSTWYRGYVAFKKEDKIKVALIDAGVVVVPEAICPMPLEIQNLPETAIIITFDTIFSADIIGEVVKVENVEFDELIYGDCYLGRVEINSWEPSIEDCGVTAVEIPTKKEVFIASFQSPKSLYVYSADPSDVVARMEFTIDLFSFAVESKFLNRKPLFGEILCCRYAEDNRFYRAQVLKKKNDKYIVSFIDYGNISAVSLNDLKPLPEIFKNVPAFSVKIALSGVSGTVFNENSINLLNGHVFDKKKFILEYSNLDDAKLISGSHNSLNNELEAIQNYSNIKDDFFTLEDLKFEKWQIGQKLKLLGVSSLGFKSYLVIDSASPTFNSVKNMTQKINEFCENHEDSVYLPRSQEICLVKFKEKHSVSWCRASFLAQKRTYGFGAVYLVDYGNTNNSFPLSDIRPISPEFMLFPAACNSCEIYGLNDDLSDEVKEAIKNEFTEEAFDGIVVNSENNVVYVPAVNEILSKFHLPAISPPKIIADIILPTS